MHAPLRSSSAVDPVHARCCPCILSMRLQGRMTRQYLFKYALTCFILAAGFQCHCCVAFCQAFAGFPRHLCRHCIGVSLSSCVSRASCSSCLQHTHTHRDGRVMAMQSAAVIHKARYGGLCGWGLKGWLAVADMTMWAAQST